jgi:bifunctional non-homologous end joining protein LigD
VDGAPLGNEWLHEIKYDGYRAITSVADGKVAIRTRNGLNWTDKFAALVPALADLPCRSAILDGEVAVAGAKGHTDFGALQDALARGKGRYAYYLFDLLQLNGEDLRKLPLTERKARLHKLLRKAGRGPLAFSHHLKGHGEKVFKHACRMKLEGIVCKLANAPYRSGRRRTWLKVKCGMEQEFVIIGWRPSSKAGRPFSSILLAVRRGTKLRYAGRVGTGYSDLRLESLARQFRTHARATAPVADVPAAIARNARFVDPVLVAEIAFRGWTRDNLVRQGAFKGLRGDKPAREVVKEIGMPKRKAMKGAKAEMPARTRAAAAKTFRKSSPPISRGGAEIIEGVRVTHPDRVMFPDQGITKRQLIRHYLSVADLILPHLADRPISLVRCPQGTGKACFFQKHASEGFPDEFEKIRIREKSGADDYLYIRNRRGLVAAAQMGVVELHIWGCHVDDIEKPDRMVFDFDPAEGLDFAKVRDAARDMRERLQGAGLESFAMLTGGKGVHVVVPLRRGHDWEAHRDFAEAMARLMADEKPERYVATMSKAKRKGKIFVDYLRNQRGATAIAPYSSRARKGATVAWPVSWAQLSRQHDAHPVSVGEAARVAGRSDPWPGYFKVKQGLPKLRK